MSVITQDALPVLDVFSQEYTEDPVGTIRALGGDQALAVSPRGIECLNYELSSQLLRDERFPVGFEELLEAAGFSEDEPAHRFYAVNTAALEGDTHRRQRRLLAPLFSTPAIEAGRGFAREVVERLLDEVDIDGFDFAAEVAPHVPSSFFCYLIGAPLSDRELIADCSDRVIKAFRADPRHRDEIAVGVENLIAYVRAHIQRKRTDRGDDVVSALLAAEERGETTEDEIIEILFTLLTASTDNTNASLSHAVLAFADHPDQWDLLRANPDLVPDAVLECARLRPNNWSDPRRAREEHEFAGITVEAGTWLFASIIGANHDPAVFEHPDEFRIDRARPKPPLNWGSGRHFCLGRPAALVELEETVRLLAERFSRIEVIGEVVREGHPHGDFIRRLPVRLTP